jgi:Transposase DDE domain
MGSMERTPCEARIRRGSYAVKRVGELSKLSATERGSTHLSDKLLLRKRAIIESIIDPLKNISQNEHSRHRSPTNFVVHLLAGLIAYSHQDKKPGLHLDEQALLAA